MNEKIEGMYLHCATCILDNRSQDIEVTCNRVFIQVWCRFHDMHVATFELKEATDG